MEHRGVVITAGFDKSKNAIVLAELLKRKNINVKGLIVVSPYSWKRLYSYINNRGFSFIGEAIPRLLGYTSKDSYDIVTPFEEFLKIHDVKHNSLKKWAKKNKAEYLTVDTINNDLARNFVKQANPQWLVYSGGGIIRDGLINDMKGRILNAHQGPLPEIRGMNAAEWAILLDCRKEVTIHLIDKGIDTGKIITRLPFNIDRGDSIKSVRDKAKIKGIEGLLEIASAKDLHEFNLKENNSEFRQCYIMSGDIKELLKYKLKNLV